ncbi:MAG: Mbeg1-like protein, partial [Lachnospiraceae bacterium]
RVMKPGRRYFIGGHSKGANLALYSAAALPPKMQGQIIRVYMNDGPGFCAEVLDVSAIDPIHSRVRIIQPEYCIIGKLFEPEVSDHYIVRSTADGILAHQMETWGIDHGAPLRAEKYRAGSVFLSQTFHEWVEKVPVEQREKFVDDLFDALAADGSHTMTDIASKGPAGFENVVMHLIGMEKSSRGILLNLPSTALFGSIPERIRNWKLNRFLESEAGKALLILLAGIVFLTAPDTLLQSAAGILLLAVVAAEVVLTVSRLHRCGWNFGQEKLRVYICITLIAVYSLILVKDQALFLIASVFLGSALLMGAYACLSRAAEHRKERGLYWRSMAETLLFAVSGAYILVAPDQNIIWYQVSLGTVLVCDAAVRLIQIGSAGKKKRAAR